MNAGIAATIDTLVRAIDDWPQPGVTFRDITPLLADAEGLRSTIDALIKEAHAFGPVDKVIGIEARGFIFAPSVAMALGAGFVPVRKPGKLPAARASESYELEYGAASVEIHSDALVPGERVLVVDDVLATGGTMAAVGRLVQRAGATVAGNIVLIEITALGGRSATGDDDLVSLHRY